MNIDTLDRAYRHLASQIAKVPCVSCVFMRDTILWVGVDPDADKHGARSGSAAEAPTWEQVNAILDAANKDPYNIQAHLRLFPASSAGRLFADGGACYFRR